MASYNIWTLTLYAINKEKDKLWSFLASSKSVMGFFKQQLLKQPKMVQVDKAFRMSSTAAGPMIFAAELKSFYDETKISGMCMFS